MTQAAVTLVLGTIAVATFMLKGKQWPTFITAAVFGIYLGSTQFGEFIQGFVTGFLNSIGRMLA